MFAAGAIVSTSIAKNIENADLKKVAPQKEKITKCCLQAFDIKHNIY